MKKIKLFILIILFFIILLVGGYFIYDKILISSPTDNIQNNDGNIQNNNGSIQDSYQNITQDNTEDIESIKNQTQFNYFVESLEANATITLIKTGKVPDFATIYNNQPYKYVCEEKAINNNGSVYLKNCKIGNNNYSYGQIVEENQNNVNFSKLYIFKDNSSDGYYALDDITYQDDKKDLLYVYNCKSKFCTYKFYDDKIFISDINLYYKDLNSNDTDLKKLSPTKVYNPNNSNINRGFYFEYYKFESFDIYRTIIYTSASIDLPIILFDKNDHGIMLKQYYSYGGYWYLSFNHKTLENGYYLYASIYNENNKQNDTKYIYDYFNDKKLHNFEIIKDDYFYSINDKFFVGNYEFDEGKQLNSFNEVEIKNENLTIKK